MQGRSLSTAVQPSRFLLRTLLLWILDTPNRITARVKDLLNLKATGLI